MKTHFAWLLPLVSLVLLVRAQLPPWEAEAFYFGWVPYNNSLTRCGTVGLQIMVRPGYTSTPPYTVMLYRPGQAIYRFSAGSGPIYTWNVNLNAGGPYLLAMDDSRGATGGVSDVFSVAAGSSSCSSSGETTGTLSFRVLSASTGTCDVISFEANGGTPPYTLTVNAAVLQPKTVVYSTGRFDYQLDIPAGKDVIFAIQDASGRSAVAPMMRVTAGSNSACVTGAGTVQAGPPTTTYPGITSTTGRSRFESSSASGSSQTISGSQTSQTAETSSKKSGTPTAAILGGVIGGLVLLVLILLVLLFRRRRSRRQESTDTNADLDSKVWQSPPEPVLNIARGSAVTSSFYAGPTVGYQGSPEAMQPTGDINYRVPSGLIHPSQQYPFGEQQTTTPPSLVVPIVQSARTTQYSEGQQPRSPLYSPPPSGSNEEKHLSWLSSSSGDAGTSVPLRWDPQFGQQTTSANTPEAHKSAITETSETSGFGVAPSSSRRKPLMNPGTPPLSPGARSPFQSMAFTEIEDPGLYAAPVNAHFPPSEYLRKGI